MSAPMSSLFVRGGMIWLHYHDAAGKRRTRSSGYRVGEEVKAQRLLEALDRTAPAAPVLPGAETLAAYAARWVEARQARGILTAGDEAARLRDHVLPVLGTLPLAALRGRHVRDLVIALAQKHSARCSCPACGGDGEPRILAPRTVRHCYGVLRVLCVDAKFDERIAANPCELPRGMLPDKRDADPAWRSSAVFTRGEVEALISDERIPEDRRVLYALLVLTGCRWGEAASLRWRDYDPEAAPLGRLVIARSYSTARHAVGAPKGGRGRECPAHPVLAAVLAEWRLRGAPALLGREVRADDLIAPSRVLAEDGSARARSVSHGRKRLLEDLGRLGLRGRRVHDLRRTLISLARSDGARPDVLRLATHGRDGSVIGGYTEMTWAAMCGAISCLRVERGRGSGAFLVQAHRVKR